MEDMKKTLSVLAAFALLMTGCSAGNLGGDVASVPELTGDISDDNGKDAGGNDAQETKNENTAALHSENTAPAALQNLTDLTPGKADTDTAWDNDAVTLKFDGDAVIPSSTDGISVSGGTLTIQKGGTYVLTGTLNDGRVVIDLTDKSEKVHLIFNGVSLTCKTGSPLTVLQADKTVITLAENTENSLTDGSTYTIFDIEDADGQYPTSCLSSKDDLTVNGSGKLTVNANANNGIHCTDDLKIVSGTVIVNAVNHGLRGNDSVQIFGGTLEITAGGDGIKATTEDDAEKGCVLLAGGNVSIRADGDGVEAANIISVTDGTYTLVTGGGAANAPAHSEEGFGGFGGGGFGGFGGFGGNGAQDGQTENGRGRRGRSGQNEQNGQNKQNGGTNTPAAEYTANYTVLAADNTAGDDASSDSHKGLKAGNYISISGGSITADTADDAVHSDGDAVFTGGILNISTGDDGLHAAQQLVIGTENAGTFDDVQIYISKAYEGVEAAYIYQNSGTVYVVSTDDGYNAGGAEMPESSSSKGRSMENSYGELYLRGGLVCVNSATGDHDGMDSNGPIYMTGGYYVCNGMESLDCGEGYSLNRTGGSYITLTGGNTDLNVRYTFADASGNVICSVLSAGGNSGQCTDDACIAYTGGTVNGGNALLEGCPGAVMTGGKLSDGKEITTAASEVGGMMGGFGGFGGRGGNSDDNAGGSFGGMTPPDGFDGSFPDGMTPPDGFDGQFPDGMTPPDGFDGQFPDDFTPPEGFDPGRRGGN